MVGHTGIIPAAIKAIETVDTCVGKAVEALKEVDGQMFICADHGNAEQMVDYETGAPFTGQCRSVLHTQRERMPGRYYPDVNRTDGNGAAGRDDRKVTSDQEIKNRTRKAVRGRGCFSCVRIQKTGGPFSGTSALVADKEELYEIR